MRSEGAFCHVTWFSAVSLKAITQRNWLEMTLQSPPRRLDRWAPMYINIRETDKHTCLGLYPTRLLLNAAKKEIDSISYRVTVTRE